MGLAFAFIFSYKVECSDKDLHSGVYGGSIHEAMTDLIVLMGKGCFKGALYIKKNQNF